MHQHTSIVRIKGVNSILKGIDEEYVFVGGAVVALYADRMAEEIRPTYDVDILVEIYTKLDFYHFEEKLQSLGFWLDTTANFKGRFIHEKDLVIDFMPLDADVLGFSNKWYQLGFNHSITVDLDEWNAIRIFPAVYFLAAKFEAFTNRGKNEQGEYDGRQSSDFEDIVFVLTYRSAVWQELEGCDAEVKRFLKGQFLQLLQNSYFEEWIDAHTGYSSPAAQAFILPRLRQFVNFDGSPLE